MITTFDCTPHACATRNRTIIAVMIGCTVLLLSQSVWAHCVQWNDLYGQVIVSNHQGNADSAITVAHRLVTAAENRFGNDHPYVAISLNILAQLYSQIKQYKMAEPLFKRSLMIYERSLGSNSLSAAQVLTEMSDLYLEMNNSDEAFYCLSRAQDIYRVISGVKLVESPQ